MPGFLEEFESQQTNSLKGYLKTKTNEIKAIEVAALKTAEDDEKATFKEVISQITTAMNVGSKPKREDYIIAAKELNEINGTLSQIGADSNISFNSDLLGKLQEAVKIGLDFIAEQKPSLKGAAAKGIANKMKETSTGFVKNLAMETVSGIPFGAAVVDWMGAKMSGFGESLTQGKKLSQTELGIGRAFAPDAAENVEDAVEDATEETAKNGGTVAGGLGSIATAGGTVSTNGNGGGLTETNEILKDILKAVTPDAEAGREAERERELERLEDAKKGGIVTGKPEDKKGLFGDFNFMDIFKKGGMKKVIASLGGTLFSGLSTAFGSTGVLGKGILAKIGPQLLKFAGPAMLLAGLAMAIKDGVGGWFKSEEWGVSNIAGALGGLFGGTGEAGSFGNVSGNALKWGLIGAGLGSIVPVIGTGIGFAAGALIGGILGYFGGEKIAKAIQAVGDWVSDKMSNILKFLGLKDKTKEDHETEIEEERKSIETRLADIKAAQEKTKKSKTDYKTPLAARGKGFTSKEAQQKELERQQKVEQEYVQQLSKLDEESAVVKETGVRATEGEMQGKVENTKKNLKQAQEQAAGAYSWFEKKGIEDTPENREKFKTMLPTGSKEFWETRVNLYKGNLKKWGVEGFASGGVIVNRPTYLPSSGVMVGEHPTYSGRGTPRDGGPEALIGGAYAGAVVPLGADRAEKFINPMSRSIAGAVMNQMAMEKIGHERGRGSMYNQPPTIIDASTVQNVSNNTLIRPPSPSGPGLHFERGDFVHKIA